MVSQGDDIVFPLLISKVDLPSFEAFSSVCSDIHTELQLKSKTKQKKPVVQTQTVLLCQPLAESTPQKPKDFSKFIITDAIPKCDRSVVYGLHNQPQGKKSRKSQKEPELTEGWTSSSKSTAESSSIVAVSQQHDDADSNSSESILRSYIFYHREYAYSKDKKCYVPPYLLDFAKKTVKVWKHRTYHLLPIVPQAQQVYEAHRFLTLQEPDGDVYIMLNDLEIQDAIHA